MDLDHPGMQALIQLTNAQFSVWTDALRKVAGDRFKVGHGMNYWFLLSTLTLQGKPYEMRKKDLHHSIPGFGGDAGRKYTGDCVRLGLIEVVSVKNTRVARLTSGGAEAVQATLEQWAKEFGQNYDRYFRPSCQSS